MKKKKYINSNWFLQKIHYGFHFILWTADNILVSQVNVNSIWWLLHIHKMQLNHKMLSWIRLWLIRCFRCMRSTILRITIHMNVCGVWFDKCIYRCFELYFYKSILYIENCDAIFSCNIWLWPLWERTIARNYINAFVFSINIIKKIPVLTYFLHYRWLVINGFLWKTMGKNEKCTNVVFVFKQSMTNWCNQTSI